MTSYVAQVGLALKILLPQSPECWNLRPVPYSMPGHTHSLASCSSLSDVLHPGVLRHWPICPMGPPKHHVLARPLSYVLLSVLLHVVMTFPSLVPKPDTRKSPASPLPIPKCHILWAVCQSSPSSLPHLSGHTILLSRPFHLLQEHPPYLLCPPVLPTITPHFGT